MSAATGSKKQLRPPPSSASEVKDGWLSRPCRQFRASFLRTAATPAALENLSPLEVKRKNDHKMLRADVVKLRLIGSYAVTGTDADGKPYPVKHTLGIALAPSGALELEWDNGWTNGKTVVLTMQINPDGSLTGKWLRRTDYGAKGTETWNRI
jgi:hypothetical protein